MPIRFFNNCWTKSEPITSLDQSDFGYITNRMLSLYPKLLKRSARISALQSGIPSWALSCLLFHTTPKMSQVPRSGKFISTKQEEENPEITAICKIFCANKKHGKQIAVILRQKGMSLGEKGKAR